MRHRPIQQVRKLSIAAWTKSTTNDHMLSTSAFETQVLKERTHRETLLIKTVKYDSLHLYLSRASIAEITLLSNFS